MGTICRNIANTSFVNNSAKLTGGAIFPYATWLDMEGIFMKDNVVTCVGHPQTSGPDVYVSATPRYRNPSPTSIRLEYTKPVLNQVRRYLHTNTV